MFMVEVWNSAKQETITYWRFDTKEEMLQEVNYNRDLHPHWRFFYYVEYSRADIERLF